MTFPCSPYQWSPSTLTHSHTHIFMCDVRRTCGFTSMIWHHLRYLPPYQLLSPTEIQPLVNDHCMQHISMECLHSDSIRTNTYVHVWRMCGFTSMIWRHLLDPLPPYQLHSPTDIQPLASNHTLQQWSMESFHPDTFAHVHIFMCDVCVRPLIASQSHNHLTWSFSFTSCPSSSTSDRTAATSPSPAAPHNYPYMNIIVTRWVDVSYSIRHDGFDELCLGNDAPINSKRPTSKSDK